MKLRNRPGAEAEVLKKNTVLCVLKIRDYNRVIFLTQTYTVVNSSFLLTAKLATKSAQAERWMLMIFLQEVMCIISISF